MKRVLVLVTASLALVGCGRKMVDPCSGEAATCVAVQIDPSPQVQKLDAATIHVVVGGVDEEKSSGLAKGGAFQLPVAVALVFADITDPTPADLSVDVTGSLAGNVVGGGSAHVSIAARQHATVHVTMTADGVVVAMPDMALPAGDADMGTCPSGFHDCSGQCVDNTSIDSCGTTACTSCPVGANATAATCDGTSCGLTCTNGFHLCNGACVSSTSTDSCNMSCTPCTAPTGGTSTCDGTSCGGACPTNQKLCAGTCIASSMACNGTCPSGTHDCSGNCFADNSVNSCGTSCTPCAVPANATNAVCVSSSTCDFVCNANYKKCGSGCIPSTGCCVTADCAQPTNGSATCDQTSHMCTISCNTNYVDCSGQCKPITDVNSCGPSCTTCSAPTNGTPTCNGTACDFTCNTGYVRSGSSCVACGAETQACCASSTCNAPFVCTSGTCQQKSLTWTVQTTGTTANLDAVWVDSSGRATVGGAGATILYCPTSAGCGPNTLPINSGDVGGVWGSGSTIYASDSKANVYSSTNHSAWTTLTGAPSGISSMGVMSGDANGKPYVVGTGPSVLVYQSTSNSWTTLPGTSSAMSLINGLWVGGPTQSDIYAPGQNRGFIAQIAMAHSRDGGQTWTSIGGPSSGVAYHAVWGTASGNVYAVGEGGAVVVVTLTSDTFTVQTAIGASGKILDGVWGSDQSGYLYAVGQGGIILHSTGDGTWSPETSPTTNDLRAVYGNPAGTIVYAVGASGTVLRGQ